MKSKTLSFLFLFLASFLFAQDNPPTYVYHQNLLKWGDSHYTKNLRGLGSLMTDVQRLDPTLYKALRPEYDGLKKRQSDANVIAGVGGGVAVLMFVGSIVKFVDDADDPVSSGPGNFGESSGPSKSGIGLLIGGAVLSLAAGLVYYNKSVKHEDILSFTNQFNQRSEGEKIKFSWRPEIELGNQRSAGLAVCLHF